MTSPATQRPKNPKKPIAVSIAVVLLVAIVAGFLLLSSPDLTISLNKTSIQVQRGTSQTLQVSLAGKNSPAEAVSLSVSGVPANVTASFSNANPQLAASGTAQSILTITASPHAYGRNSTLIISATANGLTRQVSLLIIVIGTTYNYNLEGSYAGGWSVTSINANEGDILVLHLTSKDALTHAFFVDYNGNMILDATEPVSPNFASPTVPVTFSFTITQVGMFTYFCKYHPNMIGTLHSATP